LDTPRSALGQLLMNKIDRIGKNPFPKWYLRIAIPGWFIVLHFNLLGIHLCPSTEISCIFEELFGSFVASAIVIFALLIVLVASTFLADQLSAHLEAIQSKAAPGRYWVRGFWIERGMALITIIAVGLIYLDF